MLALLTLPLISEVDYGALRLIDWFSQAEKEPIKYTLVVIGKMKS